MISGAGGSTPVVVVTGANGFVGSHVCAAQRSNNSCALAADTQPRQQKTRQNSQRSQFQGQNQ